MLMVETEREIDGRWIAEITALPGVLTYGRSRSEAVAQAEALAQRVLADRIEYGEIVPELDVLYERMGFGEGIPRSGFARADRLVDQAGARIAPAI